MRWQHERRNIGEDTRYWAAGNSDPNRQKHGKDRLFGRAVLDRERFTGIAVDR